MPPDSKKRVTLSDHGDGRGQSVHLPRMMLKKLNVDPDVPLEATRSVMGEDAIRIRIYESD